MAHQHAGRPNCDLSELLADAQRSFTVNTKYLEPNEALPVMEPSGEVDVHYKFSLREMMQRVGTFWMFKWKSALLIIAENCSTNTITRCPRELIDREQPREPHVPGPLRTNYPPTPPIEGFLTEKENQEIKNEMDNLLVDVANRFQGAQHSDSFAAAKTYLEQIIKNTTIDNLPASKRRRLR